MFKKIVLLILSFCIFNACTSVRLRRPTIQEGKMFVFSKNIDPAIIDANERGPLNILPYLSEADHVAGKTPIDFIEKQKSFIEGDIIKAGYDNQDEGEMELSGEEKTGAVIITIVVIAGVIIGAAIPILYLLDVF